MCVFEITNFFLNLFAKENYIEMSMNRLYSISNVNEQMLIDIFNACRSRTWTARSTISEVNCKYPSLYVTIIREKNSVLRHERDLSSKLSRLKYIWSRIASSSSMKPTLKKVSKYENKFAKLQKKAAEFNFRNQLKQVKKKEFTLEEEDKEVRTIVFGSSRLIDADILYDSVFFAAQGLSRRSSDLSKWKGKRFPQKYEHVSLPRHKFLLFALIARNVRFR